MSFRRFPFSNPFIHTKIAQDARGRFLHLLGARPRRGVCVLSRVSRPPAARDVVTTHFVNARISRAHHREPTSGSRRREACAQCSFVTVAREAAVDPSPDE